MAITVQLDPDEIAQLKDITRTSDDASAVTTAAREFIRLIRLRELKSVTGRVDFHENWRQLESLDLRESGFPE